MLAAAAAPQSVRAQDSGDVLEPSSDWVLDYADDSCALRRTFGVEGDLVLFEMRQFAPGPSVQFTFAGAELEPRRTNPVIRFGGDSEGREIQGASIANFGDSVMGVVFDDTLFTPEQHEWLMDQEPGERNGFLIYDDTEGRNQRERAIQSVTISDTFGSDLTLATGTLHAPMAAMRTCLDELLTHWGIDVEAHRTLSRAARPRNYQRMVRSVLSRYPTSMLRAGNSARLRIRLNVDAEGRVSDCNLQLPIEHEDFRDTACRQLGSTRFDPALDAAGNPINSYWTTSITYAVM